MSTFKFDVFLSHNSRDRARVRRLAESLQKHGLRVWLDEWVIKPGDDIYLAIERGLEQSRALVLCISPAALGSGWVNLERGTVLFRDPSNKERRFIPLLLADCDMPDTLKRYKYVDFRDESAQALQNVLAACAAEGEDARKAEVIFTRNVQGASEIPRDTQKNQGRRLILPPSPKPKRSQPPSKSMPIERKTFFALQEQTQVEAKRAIGRHIVIAFFTEGDSILLDAGSSLSALAKEIAAKTRLDPGTSHYTIMTHNLSAFQVLVSEAPKDANLNVILAGGRYDADLNALFGSETLLAFENFFPRVVVIGISGLIANMGVFCHGNTEELEVKKCIFSKRARDRILVADYTKIGAGDAMLFGSSTTFGANVDRCLLVTNAAPKEAPVLIRERFDREVQTLTHRYGVSVQIIASE